MEGDGAGSDEVLARAAGLERHSEHGLARAVAVAAAARGLDPVPTRDVRTVPGRGICGNAEGQPVAAGSGAFMRDVGWLLPPALAEQGRSREASGHSVVYVGWGGRVHAVLSLDDTPVPEVRAPVEAPRYRGLRVILLTGDLPAAAQRIAAGVGIETEDIRAGLAPEAKSVALDRHQQAHG